MGVKMLYKGNVTILVSLDGLVSLQCIYMYSHGFTDQISSHCYVLSQDLDVLCVILCVLSAVVGLCLSALLM